MPARLVGLVLICALIGAAAESRAAVVDAILFHGKIVTVDDQFSIAEAVAIAGTRIAALGSDEEILRAYGSADVRRIDLGGRTVIPGLIDGHIHLLRGAEFWRSEVRLEGTTSRSAALEEIRSRGRSVGRETWIVTLGGWSERQFSDDQRPFSREELDAVAPDNPVFLQVGYGRGFVNTLALQRAGIAIEEKSGADRGSVGRTEQGVATGQVNGLSGIGLIRRAIGRRDEADREAGLREIMATLNRFGLTAAYDPGGFGLKPRDYDALANLVHAGQSTVRVYRSLWLDTPSLADVPQTVAAIDAAHGFKGDDMYDLVAIGEAVYSPLHDNFRAPIRPTPEQRKAIRQILAAAAQQGFQYHLHAIEHDTADVYLDEAEAIAKDHNLRPLRWTFAHVWSLTPDQIDRMRRLGMGIALQSGSSFDDTRVRVAGEAGYHMPPLRLVQGSGLVWGLGTDATVVGQVDPFITLGWAVTGAMPSGEVTSKETITREQALIAHTRSNAFLAFRENSLGSIQPGKLADLVVLDRDYMTIPAEEIWKIRPVATMLGGKFVYNRLP